ncbi:uncharacterized protein J4E84_010850 [Alternaria hordeiaustralica]|uniref:uncharacterized protein n=1 Tax=Alternaria hordeiaustralica TaxID=1187925 RepID=UPI0020C1CF12|nr:uncharacterized protein J4E84_010850 [Alternaria hordeiaustralica]KAI4673853.1 hypothetical protein J4E84_010850 [Alternaria hordeiaustralica]
MSGNNNTNSGNTGGGSKGFTPMTQGDASRIQSGQAKSGGDISSGGFAARAQSAGDRNANAGGQQSGGTKK